jgi:hypothetical protein
LIERLIEPDRDNRPASAAELIELLDPFVPAPRVRRDLGKRVAELRPEEAGLREFGDQATAPQWEVESAGEEEQISGIVGAGEGTRGLEPQAEGSGPAPRASSPVRSESVVTGALPKRRGNRALIALLVTVSLIAGGVLAWRGIAPAPPLEEPPPSDPKETEIDTAAETPTASKPERSPDEPQAAQKPPEREARAEPAALGPASLTVVVYPWGDVWINGKPKGVAPLKNLSLKPGRYVIGAGQGEPTVTQTIRLRPGQKKKLKLDVTK